MDLHRANLLVPVQLRVAHQRALAYRVAHPVGDLPHLCLVGPDDAELNRKAHRRAELQTLHARPDVRKGLVLVEKLHQAGANALALRGPRRLDDELGEPWVGQFRLDRQIEARRAGAGVGREELNVRVLRQPSLEQLHLLLGGGEGCAFAQPQVDQQLRPRRSGEELLLHLQHAGAGDAEDQHGEDQDPRPMLHGPVDDASQPVVDGTVVDVVVRAARLVLQLLRQQQHAQVRREHHGHDPREDERHAHHPEDAAGVLARDRLREAHRHEARGRDQRAGQHRKCRGSVGVGGRAQAIPAFLQLHHHHLDGDDGVVHQQAECDDQRPERNAIEVPAGGMHHRRDQREHQRHRRGDHDAGAPAEEQEGHGQHDGQRLQERALELPDRLRHHPRLVGVLLDLDPGRHLLPDLSEPLLQRLAEVQHVAVLLHGHADGQDRNAVVTDAEAGRVLIAGAHGGDVGQSQQLAADLERDVGDVADVAQPTVDPHLDAVVRGVGRTCRRHQVLARQRVEHRCRRDAERCQAPGRQFHVHTLGLLAQHVDLGGTGHALEAALDVLGDRQQFGHR